MLKSDQGRDKLAGVYTALCDMIATNSSRLEEATTFCKRAVKADRHFSEAHNSLGAVQVKIGDTSSAILSFKKAAALNRKSTTAQYNLALVYVSLDQDMLAIQSLEKVLAVEKSNAPARRLLEEIIKKYSE